MYQIIKKKSTIVKPKIIITMVIIHRNKKSVDLINSKKQKTPKANNQKQTTIKIT